MGIIKAIELAFDYIRRDEEGNVEEIIRAIDGVNVDIKEGEFVAILGHNGSGKSTLAKHLNALLYPTEGTVKVDGKDTRLAENLWQIRQMAGMVFQNPDNQIIGQVVEEDVGFGPENLGVPTDEIWRRVEQSLRIVGMYEHRKHSPNKLSGGQKQRVSIAGVMAMQPKCIILDEATAMLDPNGRKEVMNAILKLNKEKGITVILITHYMEEVVKADKVYVMEQGKVVMQGRPTDIFSRIEALRQLRLDVPQVTELAYELNEAGIELPDSILSKEEFIECISNKICCTKPSHKDTNLKKTDKKKVTKEREQEAILVLENVEHTYGEDTKLKVAALKNINLKISKGEFIGLIGHTGSGKSTLIQHMNGLICPTAGKVYFKGKDIHDKKYIKKDLRSKVGLVFQYPEHQLFEATVLEDVCFGPLNQGCTKEEAIKRAKAALSKTGIFEDLYKHSPLELSGGQKRRVAIAGVLAMEPDILILDEPTAGLDPQGRKEILNQILSLQKETGISVILVSHSMEDVAEYVSRIIVMNRGEALFDDTPGNIFRQYDKLEEIGLAAPQITYIMEGLKEKGIKVKDDILTISEARDELLSLYTVKDS